MSRDRSSGIMQKVKDDHTRFFDVACSFPESVETPVILGFFIQDRHHFRDVVSTFNQHILHFTSSLFFRVKRQPEGWLVKIKVGGESIAKRINHIHSFQVWNGKDNHSYSAKPAILKEVEIRKNLLDRLIDQDISIFEDNSVHKIQSIKNEQVFCVWVRHSTNEIFVCYKRRQVKDGAKLVQEADSFWSFMSFDSEGLPSEIEILEDIDSTFHGAKFALQRLCGISPVGIDGKPLGDLRGKIYDRNILRFTREVNPTNPITSVVKECLPRETDKGWAWNKLGAKCIPTQIQALKFAKSVGISSSDEKEREFWENVTLPERMEENYLSKFDKPKFFRRKKKDDGRILL